MHLADMAANMRSIDIDEGNLQMVCYLVPGRSLGREEQVAMVTSIHESISPRLYSYMLPSGYQFLEQLPVTIGGKVDSKSLLALDLNLRHPSRPLRRLRLMLNRVFLKFFKICLAQTDTLSQRTTFSKRVATVCCWFG